MKLKAKDTLHVSAVKADVIQAGEVFEIEDGAGKSLVDRGLATEVKAAPAHENKMEAAPANKSARKRK